MAGWKQSQLTEAAQKEIVRPCDYGLAGLEPCPFCGSIHLEQPPPELAVRCIDCGASGPDFGTKQSQLDRWNKRAEPEQKQTELKRYVLELLYQLDGYQQERLRLHKTDDGSEEEKTLIGSCADKWRMIMNMCDYFRSANR